MASDGLLVLVLLIKLFFSVKAYFVFKAYFVSASPLTADLRVVPGTRAARVRLFQQRELEPKQLAVCLELKVISLASAPLSVLEVVCVPVCRDTTGWPRLAPLGK